MTANPDPQSPDPTSEAATESETEDGAAEASPENKSDDAGSGDDASDDQASADQASAPSTPAAVAVAERGPGAISPELVADPYGEEILDISAADFEALLSDHADVMGDFREGEIVHAKVLRVTDSMVILEFGFKSEGAVPLDEFKDRDAIEAGQEVEVLLESLEDDDGIVVLSKKKADFLRVWEKIREAHEADEPVEGMLARKIKGGVTVDIMGVDAFLPGSQIALRRVPNIDDLLGQTFEFKIIKLNKRRRNIVVSRRVILEGSARRSAKPWSRSFWSGRSGKVSSRTSPTSARLSIWVDSTGLLHITDMSWGRVGHPSEVVDIGARLDVKVLDIDWDRERISLGLKQLLPYPWTDIDKKYPVGSRVRGKVVSITNYGAFIELEKGVEGLVHISEMSWTRNIRHPSKLVTIGDEIEAVVLKVDMQDEKISLGMKQIEEDPWLALPAKYPTGTQLAGVVRNLTSFGAFVEIESGIDGLVHVSDLSWTRRVEHPSEVIQKGDEVQVLVLDVDAEAKRISLGIKQLSDDPWPEISERFSAGVEPAGSVARVQEKGVVVDLGDDIEGFVPTSHSGVEEEEKLPEYFRAGEPLELKVIESDAANRRIVARGDDASGAYGRTGASAGRRGHRRVRKRMCSPRPGSRATRPKRRLKKRPKPQRRQQRMNRRRTQWKPPPKKNRTRMRLRPTKVVQRKRMPARPKPKPVQTRPALMKTRPKPKPVQTRPRKRPRAKLFMSNLPSKARTPVAPRLSIVAVVAVFGCATPGTPIVEAEAGRVEPAIAGGPFPPAQRAEADSLLAQAQTALDQEAFELAEALSLEIEAEFGAAPGSAYALWIRARAAKANGNLEGAQEAARRFRTFLADGDERIAEVTLLEGDALQALGRTAEAVAAWLPAPGEPVSEEALARVEDYVEELTESELRRLVASDEGLVAPVLAEFAFRQYTPGCRCRRPSLCNPCAGFRSHRQGAASGPSRSGR